MTRAMYLRMSASFRFGFKGTCFEKPMEWFNLRNETADEQLSRVSLFVFPAPRPCPKCDGKFLLGLRDRLNAPPDLSIQETEHVVDDILTSVAEDPLVMSIHEVEVLHAGLRNAGARGAVSRKRMPSTAYVSQSLTRWVTLLDNMLGASKRAATSVRKHTLKQSKAERGGANRATSGHNLFVREENTRRNVNSSNKTKQIKSMR